MKTLVIPLSILVTASPYDTWAREYQCAEVLKEAAMLNKIKLQPVSSTVRIDGIADKTKSLRQDRDQVMAKKNPVTGDANELGRLKNENRREKWPMIEAVQFKIARFDEVADLRDDVEKSKAFWDRYEELGEKETYVGRVFLKKSSIVGFTLIRGEERINYAIDTKCKVIYLGKGILDRERGVGLSFLASRSTCRDKLKWMSSFGALPKEGEKKEAACKAVKGDMFEGRCRCSPLKMARIDPNRILDLQDIDPWRDPACDVEGDPEEQARESILSSGGLILEASKPLVRELKELCEENASLISDRVRTAHGGSEEAGATPRGR